MAVSDTFPLSPLWPVDIEPFDQKIRVPTDDGGLYVRSNGSDNWRSELRGWASGEDMYTLEVFYEAQAADVFTVEDKSNPYLGTVSRVCKFAGPIRRSNLAYNFFEWRVMVQEVPNP